VKLQFLFGLVRHEAVRAWFEKLIVTALTDGAWTPVHTVWSDNHRTDLFRRMLDPLENEKFKWNFLIKDPITSRGGMRCV